MAWVGTQHQVLEIDNKVVLIRNPGDPTEKVLMRFNPCNISEMRNAFKEVRKLNLEPEQQQLATFWFGYFYGLLRWSKDNGNSSGAGN